MKPLVSCVMPTWNRRAFIGAAIDSFLRQNYENRELVILDEQENSIEDLVLEDPRIRYFMATKRETTGTKRNRVCELAQGEIICHTDDDDWSAPDRIEDQVKRLIESGKPVTGYSNLLFWDVVEKKAKRYVSHSSGYVCGTSFCYLRSFWEHHRFRDQQKASDNSFVYPILRQVASSSDDRHMVARIHDAHTSSKNGISQVVDKGVIPVEFWENEKLRLS